MEMQHGSMEVQCPEVKQSLFSRLAISGVLGTSNNNWCMF